LRTEGFDLKRQLRVLIEKNGPSPHFQPHSYHSVIDGSRMPGPPREVSRKEKAEAAGFSVRTPDCKEL